LKLWFRRKHFIGIIISALRESYYYTPQIIF